MNEKKPFVYTYTSPERKKGQPVSSGPEQGGRPGLKPVIRAVLWGLASCLLFGLGLACVLSWQLYIPGIICGLFGIAGMAAAPALYNGWSR